MDIYEKRLKTQASSLGTGTADNTTFLRGDGTWQVVDVTSDISNIENTLIQVAWDVYSEDRAFDDIYADDLTDQTGIDTVNSTGTYNSGSSYYSPTAAATGTTTDYTSSQLDTTHWSDINSVAITQTTPGDATASAIYHAVSFDGGVTYKVYKSSAWTTVAKNNGGTWQYNNAGTLANASTNSLAGAMAQSTAQTAYQWTKTNIEAMTDANWEESGGWSTSVNTIDWTYSSANGRSWSSSSTTTATATLSADGTFPGANTVKASGNAGTYYAYKAFNNVLTGLDFWNLASTSGWICYDFGSAVVISRWALGAADYDYGTNYFPAGVKLQGSNNTTNGSDGSWTDLDSQTLSHPGRAIYWWSSTLANTTAYRYYRVNVSSVTGSSEIVIGEIKLVSSAVATPTYTKTTFNHDTEYVALDLRTNGWEASANDPTDGYVVLDVEPVDSITANTDIKTYISIDDGSHYEQVTLESTPFRTIGVHNYIRGDISGITARTDKTIKFKVTSHNSKNFKVHGLGGGVKY